MGKEHQVNLDELVKVGTWCDDCEAGGIDGFDSGGFPICPLTGKPHTEPVYRLAPQEATDGND